MVERKTWSTWPRSRLRPSEEWATVEVPDLRFLPDALWERAKARQESADVAKAKTEQGGRSGAGAAQGLRRRKYLLSGLLSCGQCGGNLTVAGKGHRRRYYWADAKEKGEAVCAGMPGLKETEAADAILSCLRSGLMQDSAYEHFRSRFTERLRAQEHESGDALRRHDAQIREKATAHANVLKAVETGDHSPALIAHFNKLNASLADLGGEHRAETMPPVPDRLMAHIDAAFMQVHPGAAAHWGQL